MLVVAAIALETASSRPFCFASPGGATTSSGAGGAVLPDVDVDQATFSRFDAQRRLERSIAFLIVVTTALDVGAPGEGSSGARSSLPNDFGGNESDRLMPPRIENVRLAEASGAWPFAPDAAAAGIAWRLTGGCAA